jgi:subtilisin family serine protease
MRNPRPTRRRLWTVSLLTAAVTGLVAFGGTAAAAPAEGNVVSADSPDAVANSYIVMLKQAASSDVAGKASNLAAQFQGTVERTYTAALHGFATSMSATQARRLAAHPDVAYVQQNQTIRLSATQLNPPSWGLDRIDQRDLPLDNSYTYSTIASNVHAYVIDTGIRRTHTDLGGRAITGIDEVTPGGTADDCNGHGTHVSGTIGGTSYGVAKGVTLVAVRVLDCSGSGTTAGVAAGVDWVTVNAIKPAVANMSLGGSADPTLDSAVANSIASGVTYGIAAGNSSADACTFSPARVSTAITVGATDISDNRASFSNFGTCVHIFAPGVNITSAWNTNDTATNTISGTSMATPHVVGAAALILAANPAWTPSQVRSNMVASATPNKVVNPGSGSPNLLLYTGPTTPPPPPPTNDFSIAVSPTSGSTTPGGSVIATVSTTLTVGAAQTIALSASGMPAAVTVTFNPTSVTSGGASTATFSTSTSTPGGTFTITITGTGANATHTTTYLLTVTTNNCDNC